MSPDGPDGPQEPGNAPQEPAEELGSAPGKRPGFLRRLYDWVLHFAETRHGPWALFGLSFAESSFFPIPPDPLLMALCLGSRLRSFVFAAICTLGSVLGAFLGYAVGAAFWAALGAFFFAYVPGVTPEAFERVDSLYQRYDFWAIFLAGLTPIPYKVFTLSAGVFNLNLLVFTVASVASRGLRFFAVAGLIWRFGEPVGRFIDRYFDRLTWAFGALVVAGFVVIEFVL